MYNFKYASRDVILILNYSTSNVDSSLLMNGESMYRLILISTVFTTVILISYHRVQCNVIENWRFEKFLPHDVVENLAMASATINFKPEVNISKPSIELAQVETENTVNSDYFRCK